MHGRAMGFGGGLPRAGVPGRPPPEARRGQAPGDCQRTFGLRTLGRERDLGPDPGAVAPRAVDREVTAERGEAVTEAREAAFGRAPGAADAVVLDHEAQGA